MLSVMLTNTHTVTCAWINRRMVQCNFCFREWITLPLVCFMTFDSLPFLVCTILATSANNGYNGINTIFHITSKMKNTWNVFTTDLVRHFFSFFFLYSLLHACSIPNVSQTIVVVIPAWSPISRSYMCVCMCFVVKKPQKNRQRPEEHYVKLKRGLKLNFNVVVSCTGNLITKHHSSAIRVGCRMHL